jgi:hypothetical protein
MKRRQFHPPPAEFSTGAARTPWLPHRMREAAAFARRWAHRKGSGAVDSIPALEDQLLALQPICSAQRVPTGSTCGAPAVAVAEIHAIDGCDQLGLSPDGDLVETLCQGCLARLRRAMTTYVSDKRAMASRCGTRPVCTTCGRPAVYLHSVFAVRLIRAGLAS